MLLLYRPLPITLPLSKLKVEFHCKKNYMNIPCQHTHSHIYKYYSYYGILIYIYLLIRIAPMWVSCTVRRNARVARCPVLNLFDSLSGVKMKVMPDNACISISIFCASDSGTTSVRYFGRSHLATLRNAC